MELDLAGAPSRYNHNVMDHYHFRCEKCNRVYGLQEPIDQSIEDSVAQNTEHSVTHHVLEVRGICKDCRLIGTS